MYHVTNDLRVKKSAKLISQGLEKSLKEKPFNKISINNICENCSVSRATFYRLFDSINDVFAYVCDEILVERLQMVESKTFTNKHEKALYCIKIWLSHPSLIKALVDNNLGWILYESHARNVALLKKIYNIPFDDEKQSDYFTSILSSLICAALFVYFKHGANEPIENVYVTVCKCTNIIAESFNE